MITERAKKNEAYAVVVPLRDATDATLYLTGQLAGWTVTAYYRDDSAPTTLTAFTPTNLAGAVEVGTLGVYVLNLTASEMNHDQVIIHFVGDTGNTTYEEVVVVRTDGVRFGDLNTKLGTFVSLDGAAATAGGMLTKLADDNAGGDFDAARHSLVALRNAVGADQYWADIDLSPNAADDTDFWTVVWHRNANLVAFASVSDPRLTVVSRADGSALIDNETLTAVSSTGAFKYDATSTERVGSNQHYVVTASATIDGATRTFVLIKER